METQAEYRAALLATTWIVFSLYTLEFVLAVSFWNGAAARGQRRYVFTTVALSLNSTVGLIAYCASAWLTLVPAESKDSQFPQYLWPVPLAIITNAIAALIERLFLTWRFHSLSKNRITTTLVVIVILVHATLQITGAIGLFITKSTESKIFIWSMNLSICLAAGIDILIPALLIWQLRKIKTPASSSSNSLFYIILINSASAGCCVAPVEVIVLILFWTSMPALWIAAGALGHIYGLTILINLLVTLRKLSPTSQHHALQSQRASPCPMDQSRDGRKTSSLDSPRPADDLRLKGVMITRVVTHSHHDNLA